MNITFVPNKFQALHAIQRHEQRELKVVTYLKSIIIDHAHC